MSVPDPPTDSLSYNGLRQALVILFVISTVAFVLLVGLGESGPGIKTETVTPTPGPGTPTPEQPSGVEVGSSATLLTWISLITSLTTLLGVISTTYLGWRKEAREAEAAERERQRHELEIERLRRDLEPSGEAPDPKEGS